MLSVAHTSNFFFWLISSGIVIAAAIFVWLLLEYLDEVNGDDF